MRRCSVLAVLRVACCLFPLALAGCGRDTAVVARADEAPADLAAWIEQTGSGGDPAEGMVRLSPQEAPLVKLGQLLFFSKTLGGSFDSACASCHHPDFAGGDALSLPVGVNAVSPDFLGPGRQVDLLRDYDPLADGGPNVPRNSLSILNTALYRSVLFFDGRVALAQTELGSFITTPESGNSPDLAAGGNLLAAQARFPVTSPDEMRNFFHPELSSGEAFRAHLVSRLKGEVDSDRLSAGASIRWLAWFRAAFGSADGSADELITYSNIQLALAAYQTSLTFTDSRWRAFTAGDASALSFSAQRGARLFLAPREQGGLGCASCHAGNFFTDEKFHNVGFPQIGRGKRADGRDPGRWLVTKLEADRFAFRTPSLLNVTTSAPFGHSGAFDTLEELLVYHANPVRQADRFDFSLVSLAQFAATPNLYPEAAAFTREALQAGNLSPLLPHRDLTALELADLTAFLSSLTDRCFEAQGAAACLAPWVAPALDDPDGNLLVRSYVPFPLEGDGGDTPPQPYPASFSLPTPLTTPLAGFPDMAGCPTQPAVRANLGNFFQESAAGAGIGSSHAYDARIWFASSNYEFEDVAMAGGLAANYVDGDCWPDLLYVSGSRAGVQLLVNAGGSFAEPRPLSVLNGDRVTALGVADIDGDYRREIFTGNLLAGAVGVLRQNPDGDFAQVLSLPMTRNTYGFAFGDYDRDGNVDVYMTHWDAGGLPGTAPALWRNQGGTQLRPVDGAAGTGITFGINQNFQFSPGFADADGDGWQDLLVASDFGTSLVLRNTERSGSRFFENVTDRAVITDENGMGSAIGDIDNDGRPDWFVSSVHDPDQVPTGHFGISGNRLYRNLSTPGNVRFEDVSESAGVRDGRWGWGSCMADFNNDGWLDIFHVNGFGRAIVDTDNADHLSLIEAYAGIFAEFVLQPPRLFLNNRNGTFSESAASWGLGAALDARGIACFDYDRDGDIDIAAFEQSGPLRLLQNHAGNTAGKRFLSLRLQGRAPGTEALGARVRLVADLDGNGVIGAGETQVRSVAANSNYSSQSPADLHFGLGRASRVESIEVTWPDGAQQTLSAQAVNQFLVIREELVSAGLH